MSDRQNYIVIHTNNKNNNSQNKNGFFIRLFPLTTTVENGESSSSSNNNKQTEEEEKKTEEEKKKITEEEEENRPDEEKKKKTEDEEEKKKKTEDALRKNKGIVIHKGEESETSFSSTHMKTEEGDKTKYNFNLVISYGSSEESVINPPKSELSTVYMGFQKKNLKCLASCSKNKRSEEEDDAFQQFFNPKMIEKLSTYVLVCGCVFVIVVAAGIIKETIASNNNK